MREEKAATMGTAAMMISLTTFMDYVTATYAGKARVVRELLTKRLALAELQRARGRAFDSDYYRPIKKFACKLTQGVSPERLDRLVKSDPRKREPFELCATGLQCWVERARPVWVRSPEHGVWSSGGLIVRIDPELIVRISDEYILVKIHFKKTVLSHGPGKVRTSLVLHLLETTLGSDDLRAAVLDARRGALVRNENPMRDAELVLRGEAASFVEIWRNLQDTAVA